MERLNRALVSKNQQNPIKVLQFGEGNFLRAFVDWMINEMNIKCAFNGGVAVVQPLPTGLIDRLQEQDGLYNLFMNGIENGEVKSDRVIVESLNTFVNPYKNYDDFIKLAELETIEYIISNTTEAGIAFDEEDKLKGPQKSYPGKLTSWLYHRYVTFNGDKEKGLIILPCELIDRNGDKLKEIVLKYAEIWSLGQGFSNWIENSNVFTNTLVDRIVPGFPKDRIEDIQKDLGYEDQAVCESERFHLWVIEGPKWLEEKLPIKEANLNIIVTDDMTPYRTRKVRILNGAHTLLVPVGYLSGFKMVKESVEDEILGKYLLEALSEEVIPTLDMPKDELLEFKDSVIERFKNPFIKHYLMSIALNSISKFKTRVLPSLVKYVELKKELPKRTLFSLACLIKFYEGIDIELKDNKEYIEAFDLLWKSYRTKELALKMMVSLLLSKTELWGQDLNEIRGLSQLVSEYIEKIIRKGVFETLKEEF